MIKEYSEYKVQYPKSKLKFCFKLFRTKIMFLYHPAQHLKVFERGMINFIRISYGPFTLNLMGSGLPGIFWKFYRKRICVHGDYIGDQYMPNYNEPLLENCKYSYDEPFDFSKMTYREINDALHFRQSLTREEYLQLCKRLNTNPM